MKCTCIHVVVYALQMHDDDNDDSEENIFIEFEDVPCSLVMTNFALELCEAL